MITNDLVFVSAAMMMEPMLLQWMARKWLHRWEAPMDSL